jgi:predicted site-specific integrase-resolvase
MPVEIDGKKHYWVFEVCRETGISRSTLLRWLKRGVIQEPLKDRRGWRIFSEEDMQKIRNEIEKTY